MPRSGEEARRRLREAALDLYRERGYDRTTTAEIAARAGVTERTFFRHFPDKREVLFDGEADFRADLAGAVVRAPAELPPLDALLWGFRQVAHVVVGNRPFSEPRAVVIAETPALRERALAKAATMIGDLAGALRTRGVPDRLATLAAEAGLAASGAATRAWIDDPAPGLDAHMVEAFADLRALSAPAVRPEEDAGSPSPA